MGDYLVLPVTGGFGNKERIHIYIHTIYIYLTHFFLYLSPSFHPKNKRKKEPREREREKKKSVSMMSSRPFWYFFFSFSSSSFFGFAWQPLSTTSHCSWCVFWLLFFVVVVYFSRCVCVCRNFPWHTNSIWNITAYIFSLTLLSFYSFSFRPVKKEKKNGTLISVWTSVANHSCWCRGKHIYDFKQNVFPPFTKKTELS